MSRHGYSYDCEQWDLIMYRGAVKSAIRGKRGQAFLRELRDALDAMPEKSLIDGEFMDETGAVCALGCVARHRRMEGIQELEEFACQGLWGVVGRRLGIASSLAREIMHENDDYETCPEARWRRVRDWVESQIAKPAGDATGEMVERKLRDEEDTQP